MPREVFALVLCRKQSWGWKLADKQWETVPGGESSSWWQLRLEEDHFPSSNPFMSFPWKGELGIWVTAQMKNTSPSLAKYPHPRLSTSFSLSHSPQTPATIYLSYSSSNVLCKWNEELLQYSLFMGSSNYWGLIFSVSGNVLFGFEAQCQTASTSEKTGPVFSSLSSSLMGHAKHEQNILIDIPVVCSFLPVINDAVMSSFQFMSILGVSWPVALPLLLKWNTLSGSDKGSTNTKNSI